MKYHYNGRVVEAPWKPNIFHARSGDYGVMWYVSRLGLRCADLEDWNKQAKRVDPETPAPRATELVSRSAWRAVLAARVKASYHASRDGEEKTQEPSRSV